MLKWMHIENLALVERADMEFGPGFNVISGETGAGKSVIMGGVGQQQELQHQQQIQVLQHQQVVVQQLQKQQLMKRVHTIILIQYQKL